MSFVDDARTSETELKFEIAAGALARLRKHPVLAATAGAEKLRSVYFDTPDHDLRNAGLSLRVRERAGRFVQTVKTRSGSGLIERGEWETAVSNRRPDAQSLANTPAGEVLEGLACSDLEPVFSTTVERAVRMCDVGGAQVEVSLDRGEIRADSSREPIRELELELKSGDASALFGLARDLAETVPIRLSFATKAERGYRLAGHDATVAFKAEQTALSATTPAAEAFRLSVRSCLAQVAGNAQLLRRVRSPQALHQTRVGLRRLRAVLSTFKPMVTDARFDWVKAEARWLAGELDRARDLDVFIHDTLGQDEDGGIQDPAVSALSRRLLSAQADAYDRALAAIDSRRFADFLLQVAAWVEIGDWTRADGEGSAGLRDTPIGDFGAGALQRLHRKLKKRGRGLKRLDPQSRHHLRIMAKKLRYAVELFAETFPDHPKRRSRYLHALKTLQDRLGELNDLTVAGRLAVEVVGRRGTEAAFAAGLIVGRRRGKESDILKAAMLAFGRFARTEPFWVKS
ncbi:MAG TPA: CHAD domain-containing protein [Caulobacteraceae bacterium]|jgi:inorganic triphosphatase YgiF|nr:CHAD domain-containing protein [Caulobacteraceae bacterium]